MNKQQGFTLIELVAVIVLLGILAVTALPRFLDLQGDAKASVLEGVQGALYGAAVQANAKALIQNVGTGASTITVNTGSGTLAVINRFPRANDAANDSIDSLITIQGDGLFVDAGTAGETFLRIGYDSDNDGDFEEGTDDDCYVEYDETLTDGFPTVDVTATQC